MLTVLASRGNVTADLAKGFGAVLRAKTTRHFLFELDHAKIAHKTCSCTPACHIPLINNERNILISVRARHRDITDILNAFVMGTIANSDVHLLLSSGLFDLLATGLNLKNV